MSSPSSHSPATAMLPTAPNPRPARGRFITFEGTEGSGKSTQVPLLVDRLRELGHPVHLVREPGGTPIGEEIRHTLQHSRQNQNMTPEAELLLINASRAQLIREVIEPALAAGEIVVCDRFYDSTVAYQGFGRGLNLENVREVIRFATGGLRPDLTLLLHVPVSVSEARRSAREQAAKLPKDRMEQAGRTFFEAVEEGYCSIAKAEPDRVKWIDATQPVPAIAANVWVLVETLLESHS